MANKGVVASTTKRVKGMFRKAKDLAGIGSSRAQGATAGKVKDAINRTADKAKGAVDEASEVLSEGTDKAKEAAKQAGKKVKEVGEKLEDRSK